MLMAFLMSGYRCTRTFSDYITYLPRYLKVIYLKWMVGLRLMVIFMSICFHLSDVFALLPLHCVTFQFDASLTLLLLSLCFLYEFFFYQASPFPAVPCTWGFAFYRTTKYQKRYIFRYRRRYHFVAIRDCWSAIIVDTLFGGQLIHSYIQDINTSLTYHFWLSGYPASSFAGCRLRAT